MPRDTLNPPTLALTPAHVARAHREVAEPPYDTSWTLLTDDDPLGVDTFATHELPLSEAPQAYETFQKKDDGMVKVILKP